MLCQMFLTFFLCFSDKIKIFFRVARKLCPSTPCKACKIKKSASLQHKTRRYTIGDVCRKQAQAACADIALYVSNLRRQPVDVCRQRAQAAYSALVHSRRVQTSDTDDVWCPRILSARADIALYVSKLRRQPVDVCRHRTQAACSDLVHCRCMQATGAGGVC